MSESGKPADAKAGIDKPAPARFEAMTVSRFSHGAGESSTQFGFSLDTFLADDRTRYLGCKQPMREIEERQDLA